MGGEENINLGEYLSNEEVFEKIISKLGDAEVRKNLDLDIGECIFVISNMNTISREKFNYNQLLRLKSELDSQSTVHQYLNGALEYFSMRITPVQHETGGVQKDIDGLLK